MGSTSRKIALCVSAWSRESTLYSWTYTKQYILRKQDGQQSGTVLDQRDELFIVHVCSPKASGGKKDNWKAGGALMHSMEDSLARYPHEVIELTANNVTGPALEWAEANNIDILILGFHDNKLKGNVSKIVPGDWGLGSTSSRTLQHTRLPLLIVRPDAALKLNKLRFQPSFSTEPAATGPPGLARVSEHPHEGSDTESMHGSSPTAAAAALAGRVSLSRVSAPTLVRTLSPGHLERFVPGGGRKVGLAYELAAAGRVLLGWAAAHVLREDDIVCVLRVRPSPKSTAESSRPEPGSPRSDEDDDPADLLRGFDVAVSTSQTGDPRERITAFSQEEKLDLLIVGRSTGSRFLKAFTPGGTVSQYVVSHAACPVMVYPHKAASIAEEGAGRTSFAERRALSLQERKSAVPMARPSPPPIVAAAAAATAAVPSGLERGDSGASVSFDRSYSAASSAEGGEVAGLQRQLLQRDRQISELKEKLAELQLQVDSQASKQPMGGPAARLGTDVPSDDLA
mmetsp:Transcript_7729/g.22888  ORF Transcript_7729/g.22888 Transcript_7729/m.22888 type:complete len:512 (+) Transcript_7729:237-1772(+)|eukprot:CAMPEP_0206138678 /NCGR_PEP_ID=MMETSP1473-20131121/3489_1 /ASSEMBLY_ACC=CAM_ASM_001109 /TAXON_ID=1461547 /ORGANISM="Stichococcus sp, Strain RCC1054" /LENGTH=511 /DNA_ID=CAMNT_0053532173 /DNA_START=192 /DNA_END=1727 /DNA_ORIENTATION=+